jgi:glycerol-3-phosphate dehydrogenase
MWTRGWRDGVWRNLGESWDVVIVGGGITGAGILGEAVRNGHKAVLIEANDFASGTSSRSTKLVHGGLRYLRQGQFLVTKKSVRERERLLQESDGLVSELAFSLAAFPGDKMPRWMYGMGLFMYDALAWKWNHQKQSLDELTTKLPMLKGSDATGGYRYFDAQTDDTRLTLRVLREAVSRGGVALNYAKADELLRDQSGQVVGVRVTDRAPGASRTTEVRGKVVINATGAWADDLRKQLGEDAKMRKIRGSHLTFKHSRIPIVEAVSLLHPKDARAVFAVPWEGVTILGTTDKDHPESLDVEPRISDEEVDYLMECAQRAFPSLELTHKDVISSWAGVRPVINTGQKDPSKESREHAIWREKGLVTIAGGKLTTFAVMARDALEAVEDVLGPLKERSRVIESSGEVTSWPTHLTDVDKARLLGRHGADINEVLSSPELVVPVSGSWVYESEIAYAAKSEGVVRLEDLLLRRARLGLLLPGGGQHEMKRIRQIAQPLLGWTDEVWESEEKAYAKTWGFAYAGKG